MNNNRNATIQYIYSLLSFKDILWLIIHREVKEEYRPFINAGNSGIYGRLPIRFDMEQEIVNEAFRILFHHFGEYCGGIHTDYMFKEDCSYEYVGKEGIIELYEKILMQYGRIDER